MKEKTKIFPFAPENENINADDFTPHTNKMKPENYTNNMKLICDWTDKKTS